MILPTKHISPGHSLLGVGAVVLKALDEAKTTSKLWENVRVREEVATFERFILALDLLYAMGLVEMQDGLLRRLAT